MCCGAWLPLPPGLRVLEHVPGESALREARGDLVPSRISGVKVLTAHPGLLFSPLQVTGGATVSERQGTSVQCGHTWIPVSFLLFSFGLLAASTFFFFFLEGVSLFLPLPSFLFLYLPFLFFFLSFGQIILQRFFFPP